MKETKGAVRVSLSLPNPVASALEAMMVKRGYDNRSMAVTEILREAFVEDRRRNPLEVMAGSITVFYDEGRPGIFERVSAVRRGYVKEIVADLGVMLEDGKKMDVYVVQGPVRKLDELVLDLRRIKGVETGNLVLTPAILPPLYEKKEGVERR